MDNDDGDCVIMMIMMRMMMRGCIEEAVDNQGENFGASPTSPAGRQVLSTEFTFNVMMVIQKYDYDDDFFEILLFILYIGNSDDEKSGLILSCCFSTSNETELLDRKYETHIGGGNDKSNKTMSLKEDRKVIQKMIKLIFCRLNLPSSNYLIL